MAVATVPETLVAAKVPTNVAPMLPIVEAYIFVAVTVPDCETILPTLILAYPELFKFCWLVPTAPVAVVVNVENAPSASTHPKNVLTPP